MEEGLSFPHPEENTFLPKTLQQNPSKGHPKLPNLHYLQVNKKVTCSLL